MLPKEIYLFLLFLTYTLGNECDKLGILIYEDLGCKPEYGADKDCPVKYACKGVEPSKDHCYFRGKSYAKGEKVNESSSYPVCKLGCFCSDIDDSFQFICAVLDCAEHFGSFVPPGCYRKYAVDKCCSLGQVCPPFDNIEKCVVEGKEYREGERFNPANTCLSCVCQKGFKGKFEEPFCKRRLCGQQLQSSGRNIQANCAAFYSKEWHNEVLCCPDDWICPDGTEIVKGDIKSEEICIYGNKTIKVGQYFERSNITDAIDRSFNKVKCECAIPPLMKCTDV